MKFIVPAKYHHADAMTRRLVEGLVLSPKTCFDLPQMDHITNYLRVLTDLELPPPELGKPWVHILTQLDMSRMRISTRVGTTALPATRTIRLYREFGHPNLTINTQDSAYKITRGDDRIELKQGWFQFLASNPDVQVGDMLLFTVHPHTQPTLFIYKIPSSDGPCIKCQVGPGNIVQ